MESNKYHDPTHSCNFSASSSAKTTAQKITLVSNNISIEQFFNQLEKQTGFSFISEKGVVSKDAKISVNVKKKQHLKQRWIRF